MPDSQREKINRLNVRSQAKKLLTSTGIDVAPVRLAPIVKFLDIYIKKANPADLPALEKISALIELENKILIYNEQDPTVRKRFSVAHEIGHLVLSHGSGIIGNHGLNSKDIHEIEANMFASELLIPFDWLKKDLKSRDARIDNLAKKYWVSIEAMGWRISNSDALLR